MEGSFVEGIITSYARTFCKWTGPRIWSWHLLACYVLEDTSKKEGKHLIVHSMLQKQIHIYPTLIFESSLDI